MSDQLHDHPTHSVALGSGPEQAGDSPATRWVNPLQPPPPPNASPAAALPSPAHRRHCYRPRSLRVGNKGRDGRPERSTLSASFPSSALVDVDRYRRAREVDTVPEADTR